MGSRKNQWLAILVLGLVIVTLVACGAEQASTSAPAPTEAPSPTAAVSRAEASSTPRPTLESSPTLAPTVEVTSTSAPATEAVPQSVAPTGGALTGLQALELALPLIQNWQADAALMELGTTIMSPLAADGTSATWSANFYSPSAQAMNGVMVQNGQAMSRAETPTQYEESRLIDPDSVKLDSDEAMRIAEENGGSEYSAQEDILAIAALNYHVAYEKVVWVINYQNQSDFTVVFTVHVDAVSGEVLLATKI